MYYDEKKRSFDLDSRQLPGERKFMIYGSIILGLFFAIMAIFSIILAIAGYINYLDNPKLYDNSTTIIMLVCCIFSLGLAVLFFWCAKYCKKSYYKLRRQIMEKLGLEPDDDEEENVKFGTKIKSNFIQLIGRKRRRQILSLSVPISLFALIAITVIEVASDLDFIKVIVAVLFFPVLLGPYFLMERWYNKTRKKNIVIDRENNTAILLQRSIFSSSYLYRRTVYENEYQNHAAKLVYNGMTLGGVSTGEIRYEKAYTSEGFGAATNRASVWVYGEDDKWVDIQKIKLTPELLKEAKKNKKLSPFIKEDYIDLRFHGASTQLTSTELGVLETAVRTGNGAAQYKVMERAYIAQFLHKDDIKYIIRWVRGDKLR